MVHVRDAHGVRLYVAGKSQPETGLDRLVKLVWKSNEKEGRVAHSTRCFSAPLWEPKIEGEDKQFSDILVEAVYERQNKAAHKYVTMMLETNKGVCNDIPNYVIDPLTILKEFREEQETAGTRDKLSGEQILSWFQDNLREMVILAVADKQGWVTEDTKEFTPEQEKRLTQAANNYGATIAKLAAPKPALTKQHAEMLKKAMDLLDTEAASGSIAKRLNTKIDNILNPPVETIELIDL